MKRIFIFLVLVIILFGSYWIFVGSIFEEALEGAIFDFDVCGDIWNISPKQLLEMNEYVSLASFEKIDTIEYLGETKLIEVVANNVIVAFVFKPIEIIKGNQNIPRFYIWSLERSYLNNDYFFSSEIDNFIKGDTALIFGNSINDTDDIIFAMEPRAPVQNLLDIYNGKESKVDWS